MIVYIETNFVFELGLGREEREYCNTLLQWSVDGRIDLRLPAYAVPEARRALRKREADRLAAVRALKTQRDDAKRHSAADAQTYDVAEQSLRTWTDREAEQVNALLLGLYRWVKFIPLDRETLANDDAFRAVKVLRGDGDLLIFASIMSDLVLRKNTGDTTASIFVTGDRLRKCEVLSHPVLLRPSHLLCRRRGAAERADRVNDITINALHSRITKVFPAQIRAAVETLTDEQVWWRPNEESNSVGNIVLHLTGSLNHFLNRNIGGIEYARDRAAEFAERRTIPKAELMAMFDDMVARAERTFEALTPERLGEPSPEPKMHSIVLEDLLGILSHISAHAAQVVWIAKMLHGSAPGSAIDDIWIKTHRQLGAWRK